MNMNGLHVPQLLKLFPYIAVWKIYIGCSKQMKTNALGSNMMQQCKTIQVAITTLKLY